MRRAKLGIVGFVAAAGLFMSIAACKKSSSSSGGGPAPVQTSTVTYSLAITVLGNGTVTSSPAGITASTTTASFASGAAVTLTATPASGSTFAGWSGAGCSGTGTCGVTMSAAKNVTATFTPSYNLTVALNGAGSGTVTSAPAGISCGSTCSASYAANTPVTLTATPGSGSAFVSWTGGGCSGTGACTVMMSAAQSVTATFNLPFIVSGTWQLSGTETLDSCINPPHPYTTIDQTIYGSLALTEDGSGNITGNWTWGGYLVSNLTGRIVGSVNSPTGFKITAAAYGGFGCYVRRLNGGSLALNCSAADPATCTLSGADCCPGSQGGSLGGVLANASGTITATR